jgi:hypothetical protein
LREQPFGFAGLFKDQTDVLIFTIDFTRMQRLRHEKMMMFPRVKQVNQRLVVYVSELKELLEGIQVIATISVLARPTDVTGVPDADLLFVSLEDSIIGADRGKGEDMPKRVPDQLLSFAKKAIALKLLGRVTDSQRMSAYREGVVGRAGRD